MRLLVTGAWADAPLDVLRARGHEVVFMPREDGPLPCDPSWPEGIVCNGLFLHHPAEAFSSLRLVQLTSAGRDRVPVGHFASRGIELRDAAGVYAVPMAEHAVSGVLQLYRKARLFAGNQARHVWAKDRTLRELHGRRVLIVGCGHAGRACARLFAAFGCPVTGLNRTVRPLPHFGRILPLDRLDDIMPDMDVVVLTLALTPDTVHILDPSLLRDGAVLVNVARGALVDTDALVRNLPRLRGAVLDVSEEEPLPPDHPLWDMPNVVLTPHVAFIGDGNAARRADLIMRTFEPFAGQEPNL